jgi:hypothetical protein
MAPILGIWASSKLAGVQGSYESIATVTLSSNQTSISFTSISSAYTHLQLRCFVRMNRSDVADNMGVQFNSDTATNYSWHNVRGDGSGVGVENGTSVSYMYINDLAGNTATSGIFGGAIIDILDYADTNKYKTIRVLSGNDRNGAGGIAFSSGNWRSTSAISSISLSGRYGSGFISGSTVALYGIKGA